jgi:DNA repair exonuclease SbcCD ATPase subunit
VFYDRESEAIEHRATLAGLQQQIANKLAETDPYAEQILEMRNTALVEISYNKINKLVQIREHEEFLIKLLTNKDSFIRKKIIDQNLNYLNTRLGYYLEKIGLPHQVQFKNDLSVEITELGRDLDFDNLSRGERNRLILSLSWAFRDVYESLYHRMNLLFVDELVDSGLDASGMESSLAILKKFSRDTRKSVWLVSHRDELISRVSNILRVTKQNGFTTYSNEVEV